jgi:hypothetical protein
MELVTKVIPVIDTPPGNPEKSLYKLPTPIWLQVLNTVRTSDYSATALMLVSVS